MTFYLIAGNRAAVLRPCRYSPIALDQFKDTRKSPKAMIEGDLYNSLLFFGNSEQFQAFAKKNV